MTAQPGLGRTAERIAGALETFAGDGSSGDGPALTWERPSAETFVVTLPGAHKLRTTCVLEVTPNGVGIHAFVVRRPDENHAAVHRYLLERNLKLRGIAFCVDALGDIHLRGNLPLTAVGTPEAAAAELDTLLGSVLETADGSFDRLLELGFAESIRREWRWRLARGESTANLEAFRHLR